ELYFSQNDYNRITLNGFNIRENRRFPALSMHGSTSLVAGLFNVYYEFYDEDYSDTRWVPYVGLGLGYGSVRNELKFYYNAFLLNQGRNTNSVSTPVGQAILGINYFFTENLSLGTDARYIGTKKIDTFDSTFSSANLNLLLNYSFDQPAY
ncbi:MAG: complex I NDUFA12 subunit family protein, partial [Cyanobacteria bacterium]|nr:complex I NDUFA12 subunit family protein [Cyanobacteriota bacterium]